MLDILVGTSISSEGGITVDGLARRLGHLKTQFVADATEATHLIIEQEACPPVLIVDSRANDLELVPLIEFFLGRGGSKVIVLCGVDPPTLSGLTNFLHENLTFICRPTQPEKIQEEAELALEEPVFETGIYGLELSDLLQLLAMVRKSAEVVVRREGRVGLIFVEEGILLDAELDALTGEEAFLALLRGRGGEVLSRNLPRSCPRTVERPLAGMLLEAAVTVDETRFDTALRWPAGFLADEPAESAELARLRRDEPAIEVAAVFDIKARELVELSKQPGIEDWRAVERVAGELARGNGVASLDQSRETVRSPRSFEEIMLTSAASVHAFFADTTGRILYLRARRDLGVGTLRLCARRWLEAAPGDSPS